MKGECLEKIRVSGSGTGVDKLHKEIRRAWRRRRKTLEIGWQLSTVRTVQSESYSRSSRVADQHLGSLESVAAGAQERGYERRSKIIGRHVVTVRPDPHV